MMLLLDVHRTRAGRGQLLSCHNFKLADYGRFQDCLRAYSISLARSVPVSFSVYLSVCLSVSRWLYVSLFLP